MIYAFLKDGVVVSVETLDSLSPEQALGYSNILDVTNEAVLPEVGWTYYNNEFHLPNGDTPAQSRKISKLSLRNRFTLEEKSAIESFSRGSGEYNILLAVWIADFNVSSYIDLDRADVIEGINFLEQLQLIAAGRASVILNTPVSNSEIYRE